MSACGSPDDGDTGDPRSASTPSAESSASENPVGTASAEPNYDNVPDPKTPVDETPQEFEKDGLGVYDLEFVMKPEADLSAFSEDGESSWGRGPHKAADGRMVVSAWMPGGRQRSSCHPARSLANGAIPHAPRSRRHADGIQS